MNRFFNEAPIDWINWIMWRERPQRKRTVRLAWKGGPGWVSLEGIAKPAWLVADEIREKVNREWAQKVSRL